MRVISPATQVLLNLSMLKGVGPAALKKAIALSQLEDRGIEAFANAIPQIERALSGENEWVVAQEKAFAQIEAAEHHEARIISPADAEYPALLAATKDDPCLLYVKGTLFGRAEQSVAIIGTREPTYHGEVIGRRISQFFVEQGWSVVSGLAIGCDAIAHQAVLEAGGHTVAVLAHGLQMIAPPRHKKLAQDILVAGGALVSEYPFGQAIQNQQYVKRDRTQAGMAQGVVMIQSDLKGGSLHASRATLDYNRWLAVPFPTDKDRLGQEPKVQANLLIAEGGDSERVELLRCRLEALSRIITLRSREDYLLMIAKSGIGQIDIKPTRVRDPLPMVTKSRVLDLFEQPEAQNIEGKAEEKALVAALNTLNKVPQKEGRNYRILFGSPDDSYVSVSQTLLEISRSLELHPNDTQLPYLSGRLQFIQTQIDTISEWAGKSLNKVRGANKSYVLVCMEEAVGQMKRVVKGLEPWNQFGLEHVNNRLHLTNHQMVSRIRHYEQVAHKCLSDIHSVGRSAINQDALLCLLDPDVSDVTAWEDMNELFVLSSHSQSGDEERVVHFTDLVCSFSQLVEVTLFEDKAIGQPVRSTN